MNRTIGPCAALALAAGLAATAPVRAQFTFSSAPSGSFTDISSTGALIGATGDDADASFTSSVTNALVQSANLFASTNGTLTDSDYSEFEHAPLPVSGLNLLLCPLWADMYIDGAGEILHESRVENGVTVEIIEWYQERLLDSGTEGARGNFEVKIFASGPVLAQFIYDDPTFADSGAEATVGAQSGFNFEQYSIDSASLSPGQVLSIVPATAGACCIPTIGCRVVTANGCTTFGGVYRGDNVACPSDCAIPVVANGGFETGDFSGWTQFGDTSFTAVDNGDWVGFFPNGGTYEAHFGPVDSTGGVQQNLQGVHAGDHLTIDFFYACAFDEFDPTNSFSADFDGQNLVSFTNDADHQSYTEFTFEAVASVDNPVLSFTFFNPPTYGMLDDVTVTNHGGGGSSCYANCDHSTAVPFLNVIDFTCFLQKFAAADPYANCDGSTQAPTLNVIDFTCFLQKFAAGCSAP